MGFLVLLKFAVKCFDIFAWPLLSLGYPLCASIRAIEADSNSEIRNLVTYWVLFSLISLFDHAFARLLEWLSFWPYVKLMIIFWLLVPHFDGSLYVYENLVRPCFSVNPLVAIERCNKRKEKLFLERENFLVEAEIYLKENGPEALEKLIAGKCTKPNVDVKEIKAVAATEKKEVESLKCKEPNVAQKEIKEVEVTEKKELEELAAEKRVNQTVPNLPQTEKQTFTASGTKETAATTATTAGSDSKLPEIPASMKVQKEWACALCQVTTQSETTLHSHLQGQRHRAAFEELKAKCRATKTNGSNQKNTGNGSTAKRYDLPKADAKKSVSSNGSNQKNTGNGSNQKNTGNGSNQKNTGKRDEKVEVLGKQKNPNKTGGGAIQQSKLWCYYCNVRCPGEIDMACHLNGKKHFARIQELMGNAGGGLG